MATTPARQFRVSDALWNAAKDAAARRDTTRTAYLVAKLEELVAADRAEQAFINGLEAPVADVDDGAYVRRAYNVPAAINGRVRIDGQEGTVVGFDGPHLRVLLDGYTEAVNAHPTWRVEYLAAGTAAEAVR